LGGALVANLKCKEAAFIICDRTFKDLYEAGRGFTNSNVLTFFFKLFTLWRWNFHTVEAFLSIKNKKLLSFDIYDEIINKESSLKQGITEYLIKESKVTPLVNERKMEKFLEILNRIVKYERINNNENAGNSSSVIEESKIET
jgi:hypothetical protein